MGLQPSTLKVNICQGIPLIPEKVCIGGPHELLCEHTSYHCWFRIPQSIFQLCCPAVCGIDRNGLSLQSPMPFSGGKKTHHHVGEWDMKVMIWDRFVVLGWFCPSCCGYSVAARTQKVIQSMVI